VAREVEAEYEQKLAALRADYEARLAGLHAEYPARIARQMATALLSEGNQHRTIADILASTSAVAVATTVPTRATTSERTRTSRRVTALPLECELPTDSAGP